MDWILFGAPGSGKGTQAERLAERLDLFHFSTGDVLRQNVSAGTALGRKADEIMKRGDLVPDDVIVAMVRDKLGEPAVAERSGVLFDGFPRTTPQAEAVDETLAALGRDFGATLALEVDEEELVRRLLDRGRADDTEETIRQRLEVYKNQTSPVLDFYERRGKLVRVDGTGDIPQITERLLAAMSGRGA